jgi:hypothetical protein
VWLVECSRGEAMNVLVGWLIVIIMGDWIIIIMCTGALERYRFAAPSSGIGEEEAQAEASCAVT